MWRHDTRPLNSSLTAQALIFLICVSTHTSFAQSIDFSTYNSNLPAKEQRRSAQDVTGNEVNLYFREMVHSLSGRTFTIVPVSKGVCDQAKNSPLLTGQERSNKTGDMRDQATYALWQWCELLPTKKYVENVITDTLDKFAVSDQRLAESIEFKSLKQEATLLREEVALLKRRIDSFENERKSPAKSKKSATTTSSKSGQSQR